MISSPVSRLRQTSARVVRVSRGLADAQSRPRYIAALRTEAGHRVARARNHQDAAPSALGACLACGAPRPKSKQVTHFKDPAKSFTVHICSGCGHVANPDNFNDYSQYSSLDYSSLDQSPVTARVGTPERPGREYHMAKMATEILGSHKLDVLIVGPGRSTDFLRIAELAQVRKVMIGDVVELHGVTNFVNLLENSNERFDLIIACEVIEHLTHPAADFPGLFRRLKRDGLLLCSTNIYDGGDLNKHNYLFIKGHTSYYSPRAIEKIARAGRMLVDFRVPIVATTFGGPRKRYVFFTRSPRHLAQIAHYFGGHAYAPSEK